MRLATFTEAGRTRLGVVTGERVVDLARAAPGLPHDMIAFLEAGDAAMAAARDAVAAAGASEAGLALDAVTLEAPVPKPGKILAIGLNYADHIAETGRAPPEHQMWFNKQRNAVNPPFAPVELPAVAPDQVDYEAELCMVIGKHARHVPRARAHEVIAGFCCGNDVSARDWQWRVATFTMGKSFPTHAPLGPWLVTPDEVGDPHDLDIRCLVNGAVRQASNTRHLIFDCFDQIAHLTQAFPLEPGDVIFTGTPSGVGAARDPRGFLSEGDTVRVEIERLGAIEAQVRRETAQTVIE
jgi:2-keto-4-pentenoate hydratase/2-oxohepta-3-ene-1,7-dioic acid hydratase in catechol pathway